MSSPHSTTHPTTSWDYGLHHYDMVWEAALIRLHIAASLKPWEPLIQEVVAELEQLIETDLTIGPAMNDEPRIEFRPLADTGAPDQAGVLGYAELYVTDDFTRITGGRIGLLEAWDDPAIGAFLGRYIIRHELMHVLGGTRDYTVFDSFSPDVATRNPGPVQTVMSYDYEGGRDGFGAADIAWLQYLFGPSGSDDVISGGAGTGDIFGGQGHDAIYGNQGADWLYGNQGADTLFGSQGDDWLHGGQGNDLLVGGLGIDTLIGGLGHDTIIATPHDLVISTPDDLVILG